MAIYVWNIHYYWFNTYEWNVILKGGKNTTKQANPPGLSNILYPICFRLHIYFSFFGQKKQYYKELIHMPPSFPLLQCHGEHDLQLYLTKPNFLQNKCPNVYTHQPWSTSAISTHPYYHLVPSHFHFCWLDGYKLYHIVLTSISLIITED